MLLDPWLYRYDWLWHDLNKETLCVLHLRSWFTQNIEMMSWGHDWEHSVHAFHFQRSSSWQYKLQGVFKFEFMIFCGHRSITMALGSWEFHLAKNKAKATWSNFHLAQRYKNRMPLLEWSNITSSTASYAIPSSNRIYLVVNRDSQHEWFLLVHSVVCQSVKTKS